ncbi:MAG: DRTGG domain-containing protein, partial [Halanaerobium sp.]
LRKYQNLWEFKGLFAQLYFIQGCCMIKSCKVVLVEGKDFEQIAVKKACRKDVNLLKYRGSKFELAGKFYEDLK